MSAQKGTHSPRLHLAQGWGGSMDGGMMRRRERSLERGQLEVETERKMGKDRTDVRQSQGMSKSSSIFQCVSSVDCSYQTD